jgi:hypothetical protein
VLHLSLMRAGIQAFLLKWRRSEVMRKKRIFTSDSEGLYRLYEEFIQLLCFDGDLLEYT